MPALVGLLQLLAVGREPICGKAGLFLYLHIAELIGVENLSAVLALYELDVVLA